MNYCYKYRFKKLIQLHILCHMVVLYCPSSRSYQKLATHQFRNTSLELMFSTYIREVPS
jgi:hypothetical protein